MRKFLLVLFVVALVAVAGLPPVFGFVYERQFEEQMNAGQLSPYTEFRVAEFKRGLYSSQATVAFSLSEEYIAQIRGAIIPDDPDDPVTEEQVADLEEILELIEGEVRFDVDIQHGPTSFPDGQFIGLAVVRSTLDSSAGELAELQNELGLPHLFAVDAQVGIDGSTSFQGSVPAFQHQGDGTTVNFSGLNIDGHYNTRERKVVATSAIDSLSVNNADFELSIAGMGTHTDATLLENYFSVGKSDIRINEIVLLDPNVSEQAPVRITNAGLSGTVDVDESGDNISMDINYFIDDISGFPEMEVSNVQLNFGLSKINLEAMYSYIDVTRTIGLADPDKLAEFSEQIQAIAFQVLNGSPTLSIDPVAFNLNGEPFLAKLQIDFDGNALPPGSTLDVLLGNPFLLMDALSGTARIEASDVIANLIAGNIVKSRLTATLGPESEVTEADIEELAAGQSQMMIETFVQQGIIKRSGALLSSDISYKAGELVVNETRMPLGMF
jgi:uncharacterized protein YdgA (DUF945 family)